MRIIDADALERQIQEAYCAECDDYNGIRCRACSIDDALIQVDAAPTIDAIPVEWLEAQIRPYTGDVSDIGKSARNGTIKDLIRKWQKEKEAQDGKA